jgi:hypothetical protein
MKIIPGYFEGAGDASELQERVERGAELVGATLCGTALDVGGRNGLYVPTFLDLGFERVIIVDPDKEMIDQAVESGIVADKDTYRGEVQTYVAEGHQPADAAISLNMPPSFSQDRDFIGGLARSVRAGGWIIVSMSEPLASMQFRTTAERYYGSEITRVGVAPPSLSNPTLTTGSNCYIHFWQHR